MRKSRIVSTAARAIPPYVKPLAVGAPLGAPGSARTAAMTRGSHVASQMASLAAQAVVMPSHSPSPLASTATDEALVLQVLAGDEEMFGELVKRHQRQIVNFIYRMVGDSDVALDMSQDVFIRVYQALDRFDPRYRFTTWIYRIASNCAIDRLRRHQPTTISLDAPSSPDSNIRRLQIPSTDQDPRASLESKETMQRLDAAIRRLPPSYRKLIVLRHVNSMRYEQIAAVTRLPLGTVKNRIFRARAILRREIDRPEPGARSSMRGETGA